MELVERRSVGSLCFCTFLIFCFPVFCTAQSL
jgi:hypothetical protein